MDHDNQDGGGYVQLILRKSAVRNPNLWRDSPTPLVRDDPVIDEQNDSENKAFDQMLDLVNSAGANKVRRGTANSRLVGG